MKEKKEKKEKKETRPLNEVDYKAVITEIVDNMFRAEKMKEQIKDSVKYLVTEYGLKAPAVRAAATLIFKQTKQEFSEKSDEIIELVEKYESKMGSSQ